jgi:cell pole-organizing protein PopZ
MEEILASIRRIISEDDAEEVAHAPEEAAPEPEEPEDDVFELTEAMEEFTGDEPESEQEPEQDPVSIAFDEEEPVPELEVEAQLAEETQMDEEEEAGTMASGNLVSDHAATATSAAFAGLSAALGQSRIEGRTLEDIVKELLRPMLKEWLDQNLPPLVEKIVREEVERLSRRL